MDHGIETPEERLKKGKAPEGRLQMELFENDGYLILKYSDDGRGLNLKKLKDLGLRLNLIKNDSVLTPKEICELIFLSGISTSSQVTDISGRGVGMGAVKEYLERVQGRIAIELVNDPLQEPGFAPFELQIKIPARFWAPPFRLECA